MKTEDYLKTFAREVTFVAGAKTIESLPKLTLPEVAFVGRSNVGKSTLINTLCNRKKLVKTSKSPGHTKQINFFNVDNIFTLVDLPGYGFSSVSHKIKESWGKLILNYFQNTKNLRLVNLLIDFRRNLRESDFIMIKMMQDLGINWQAIITKVDRVKKDKTNIPNIISALNAEGCYNIRISGHGLEEELKNIRLSIINAIV